MVILVELSRPEKGSHLYILLQDTIRGLMFYSWGGDLEARDDEEQSKPLLCKVLLKCWMYKTTSEESHSDKMCLYMMCRSKRQVMLVAVAARRRQCYVMVKK